MKHRFAQLVLAALILAACNSTPPSGPIGDPDFESGWSTWVEQGHRFSPSAYLRIPDGIESIVVRDLQPIISGEGLHTLGVMMAPEIVTSVQVINTWPPVDEDVPVIVPAIGATLPGPGSEHDGTYEFYVGVEVTATDRVTIRGYRLIYEHDGREYSDIIPMTVAICVYEKGSSRPDEECEDEYDVYGR